MSIYIRSTACISPQHSFSGTPDGSSPMLADPVEYFSNRLTCIEPDYKGLIDPKLIRRMSRVIKMGVAAATKCLQEAGVPSPDAIVTGTAYGCLEDTGIFLTRNIEQQEEMLSPTAFIQSTHNTVGGQIALLLKCHGYNNTFVHRGHSFESALLDSMMLLEDGEASNVLVGGLDELTDASHSILSRFGLYKPNPVSNLTLFSSGAASSPGAVESRGTIAGEGAAFFLLTSQPSSDNYARLDALETIYKPRGIDDIREKISAFLKAQQADIRDIDLIITGENGDREGDTVYRQLQQTIFKDKAHAPYKHLCGEYPVSTSFALWMIAHILKTGGVRKILLYNHSLATHHSLMLVSAIDS